MLENWLKQSLTYRWTLMLLEYLNHSFVAAAFEYTGRLLVGSKVGSCLKFIATRPCYPDGSFFYRFLEKLNKKSMSFRDKALVVLKESFIYRMLVSSKTFPLVVLLFIPMVALYAFIDELGREVFGNFPLFGSWDEAYLLLSALFVMISWFFYKRNKPLDYTPVGAPMLLLIAASFFLLLMNTKHMQLGIEGFRVVVQYILWFFILNSYLTDDKKAYLVTRLLVYAGGIMGFHGVYQYIIKVPTPKNWMDSAEGTSGTRVFSIVESPNVLGSIFILMIPLCLALVLQKKRNFNDRAVFFVLLGAMGLSLIFTLSRGAWLGAAFAMFVFCLAINPRWIILLGLGGSAVLLVPSVMSRIQYMLSPNYIKSSMSGGRLLRYQKGLQMFSENKVMGVGLGHFGGAVAMNNKTLVPNTFYMDNYWLKSMVEMGTIGIAAFAVLFLFLIVWSIRSIKLCKDYDTRLIAAGGFAGLSGVILHNFTENIFEVPYMVVYFWVIASIVLYFGLRRKPEIKSGD